MYHYSNVQQPFSAAPTQGGMNWLEIPAVDLDAARKFYQAIFPSWKFENPPQYPSEFIQLFKTEEPNYIEGAILKVNPHSHSSTNGAKSDSVGCVPFFLADSIEELEAKIIELGGRACCPKTDGRGDGWYAKYYDPEGNVFGVWQVVVKK